MRLNNIRLMEQALIDNSNLTTLSLDDEFIDAFVTRIVPCEGRKFKWYINVGTGESPGFFTEDSYELYDYFTLGFSTARSFLRARNQYLRQNQWEDLRVEIYIRTN